MTIKDNKKSPKDTGAKKPGHPKRNRRNDSEVKEFEERVIEVSRVTRVVKGGKRLRFRTLVVVGNRKGKISFGIGKAGDVSQAVQKAVAEAKKNMRTIFLQENTIPYQVNGIHKSANVLVKPAKEGTGLIAGGPVRIVLQLVGLRDAVAKMLGSKNKISNVMATIDALDNIIPPKDMKEKRFGKSKETSDDKEKSS